MLRFPLEGKFSAVAMGAADEKESQSILKEKKFVPNFIIAENTPDTLSLLAKLQAEHSLSAKLVLCNATASSPPPAEMPGLKFIGYAAQDDLLKNLELIIQSQSAPQVDEVKPDYCRINTALLLKFNPLAANIYIRLSPTKFVHMFQKNDVFDENDLKRYRDQKKVDYLYLKNEDSGIFLNKLVEELKKMLSANPPPSPIAAAETVGSAVETIHSLIDQFGVTEEVQEAVKGSVDVTLKTMGDYPELGDVLKNIKDHNGKYIGHHSMVLTNIACALAVELDWVSDATFEKLTMAAFMHDAALSDHDLCAVKGLADFEKLHKGKFTPAQMQAYRTHPEKSAMMLNHFKDLPAEVDKIVMQHHEHPMGSGFPAQVTGNYISPLGSLFIVAHDLTDYLIDKNGDMDVDDFLEIHKNKYSAGNFKKIAKALSDMYE